MANTWVDFRTIKQTVSMRMVLDHYRVTGSLKEVRGELRGRCPIHNGEGADALHVNVDKNCFQCFSCKAKGNVLDFCAAMEKCSVRDAAVKLTEWFSVASTKVGDGVPQTEARGELAGNSQTANAELEDALKKLCSMKAPSVAKLLRHQGYVHEADVIDRVTGAWEIKNGSAPGSGGVGAAENPPLNFELKGVDLGHAYLAERGITAETAQTFGVGFFGGRGSMSGRVVIPIRNGDGKLVAYAGRSIDGDEPKYKFPAGFQKSLELFNYDRARFVQEHDSRVIVVEGFFDCMKVWQAGFQNVVALMGCSMSTTQEKSLSGFRNVLLLLDGDKAGRAATGEIAGRLMQQTSVRTLILPDGTQPDRLSAEQIRELLVGK